MADYNKEVREAIDAGETALTYLYSARDYLDKARGWGIWDIFGGGLLSTFFKHSRIDDAKGAIYMAKQALDRFDDELDDVAGYDYDLGISEFATFADWFFDGLIADIYVQTKINEAKYDVNLAISRVEEVLRKLKNRY